MKTMRLRQNVATSCQLAASPVLGRLSWSRMAMRFNQFALPRRQAGSLSPRAGTTLTEVLMSLMIMSIGIVSVATLFPISAMRTLEANKQTNSAIASFNANAAIDARPELIHNPDDGVPELLSLFSTEPPASKYTSKSNLAFGTDFRDRRYVVDPWGYYEMPTVGNINTEFGNVGGTALPTFPVTRRVMRYKAWLTSAIDAAHFVSQPDSWKFVTEAALDPTGTQNALSLTLDSEADLSSVNGITGVVTTQAVLYRATIFDADGAKSETRLLSTNPIGQQVTWATALPTRVMEDQNGNGALDPGEDYDGDGVLDLPSRVRIEVADQVYTWMLTVRKASTGKCAVDAVVFFKRSFDPAYEEVHTADFRVNGFGPDDIPGTADDTPGPNYRVRVQFTGDPPAARRGGYVFDTSNGFWYRIRTVEKETSTELYLVVDEQIRANNGPVNQGGAILHPKVVNVFPLENKEP